ncbi:MAG: IS110 family transposase, partial [Desulfobacteraceae bacterium]|nr:IS110 family transposase [Desulfobacteraceae bacterium]
STESVAKMRVIETNDTGKTDIKDPYVIHTLASIGKTQRHRSFSEPYNLFRRWNKIYDTADKNCVKAKAAMEILYEQACFCDSKLPKAYKGVITTFHLARIIAETGPLSDFDSWRKLMRFAGFNLCERQSGKYRGKTKISKKGRRLIRKVLNLIILPLIRKQSLYSPVRARLNRLHKNLSTPCRDDRQSLVTQTIEMTCLIVIPSFGTGFSRHGR